MRLPFLLAALCVPSPALAHPGGHGDHGDEHVPARPAATTPAATVIPATYAEVVAALSQRTAAANTALDGMKIVDLSREVRAMGDLTAALSTKAEGLSAESKATVATKATSLKQQIDSFLAAANSGDIVSGRSALVAIQAELTVLAGLK